MQVRIFERCHACVPLHFRQIEQYLNKISGPLADRIDIHVEVGPTLQRSARRGGGGLLDANSRPGGTSAPHTAGPRILQCPCADTSAAEAMRAGRCRRRRAGNGRAPMGFSARAHDRILKVARTVADLDQSDGVSAVAEAIQYRSLDRNYWSRPTARSSGTRSRLVWICPPSVRNAVLRVIESPHEIPLRLLRHCHFALPNCFLAVLAQRRQNAV